MLAVARTARAQARGGPSRGCRRHRVAAPSRTGARGGLARCVLRSGSRGQEVAGVGLRERAVRRAHDDATLGAQRRLVHRGAPAQVRLAIGPDAAGRDDRAIELDLYRGRDAAVVRALRERGRAPSAAITCAQDPWLECGPCRARVDESKAPRARRRCRSPWSVQLPCRIADVMTECSASTSLRSRPLVRLWSKPGTAR